MHRDALKKLLENYSPELASEIAAKKKMLEFLTTHVDCFERSCIPGHFTGSSWLVSSDYSKTLLTHHKKLDRWLQLGGHCDGESNLLEVSLKEAREESGIEHIVPLNENIFDIDVHLIPARKDEPAHYHLDVRFLLRIDGDDSFTISDESHDLRWFNTNSDSFPTDEASMLRMLDKWLLYKRNLQAV